MTGTCRPPLVDKKPRNLKEKVNRIECLLGDEPYRVIWQLDYWDVEKIYSHDFIAQVKEWMVEIVGQNFAYVKVESGLDQRIHVHFLISTWTQKPDDVADGDWNIVRIGTSEYSVHKAYEYLQKVSDARATNKYRKIMPKGFVNAQEDYIFWGVRNGLNGKRNPNTSWEIGG